MGYPSREGVGYVPMLWCVSGTAVVFHSLLKDKKKTKGNETLWSLVHSL